MRYREEYMFFVNITQCINFSVLIFYLTYLAIQKTFNGKYIKLNIGKMILTFAFIFPFVI